MFNTLTIKVMGMIESKKKKAGKKDKDSAYQSDYQSDANRGAGMSEHENSDANTPAQAAAIQK